MIHRNSTQRPSQSSSTTPRSKYLNSSFFKHEVTPQYNYYDDVIDDYEDIDTASNTSEQLERIEEKLAKIEGMIQKLLNQNMVNNSTSFPSYVQSQPQQYQPQLPVMEGIQPTRGSMLGEIQSVLAQQGGIGGGPEMAPMPTMASSVATMASSAYDDDVPNIIGLD